MQLRVSFDAERFIRMTRLSGETVRRVIAEASGEAAQLLAGKARQNAPVRTGFLRSSIVAVGGEVQVRASYAGYVEDRRPFLRPAVDETNPVFLRVLLAKAKEAFSSG